MRSPVPVRHRWTKHLRRRRRQWNQPASASCRRWWWWWWLDSFCWRILCLTLTPTEENSKLDVEWPLSSGDCGERAAHELRSRWGGPFHDRGSWERERGASNATTTTAAAAVWGTHPRVSTFVLCCFVCKVADCLKRSRVCCCCYELVTATGTRVKSHCTVIAKRSTVSSCVQLSFPSFLAQTLAALCTFLLSSGLRWRTTSACMSEWMWWVAPITFSHIGFVPGSHLS